MKEPKSVKFVLQKDKVLMSRLGRSIEFKKGVPTHVPPELYKEAQAIGAVPEVELKEEEKKPSREPSDVNDRKKLIMAVFERLAAANKREDFTANGAPHQKALERELGFAIEAKERDALWHEFQQPAKDD